MRMIADMYENKCVERAISTMRSALGYTAALPDNWPVDTNQREVYNVIDMVSQSFPEREIRVWCTRENWNRSRKEVVFQGIELECTQECNDFLFAFSYHGDGIGHMVVGWPVGYGDMSIGLIVGVSILVDEHKKPTR